MTTTSPFALHYNGNISADDATTDEVPPLLLQQSNDIDRKAFNRQAMRAHPRLPAEHRRNKPGHIIGTKRCAYVDPSP